MRRSGYPTKGAAQRALDDVLARYGAGVRVDDRQTVAGYLTAWLDGKRHALKPKTMHRYSEIVTKELVPAFGALPLEQLRHDHVTALVSELEDSGRGAPTIRYVHAVLSSALSDAVRQHRLSHNVAEHTALPPVQSVEREPWTAAQAVRFLEHAHQMDDRLADLFELIIGTGMRRGEALALHWSDVDLVARVLCVHPTRGTLSDVAGRLMFTAPKTKGSAAGVGLSARVVDALKRQSARQAVERAEWAEAYEDGDLAFARENGTPLRPEFVLGPVPCPHRGRRAPPRAAARPPAPGGHADARRWRAAAPGVQDAAALADRDHGGPVRAPDTGDRAGCRGLPRGCPGRRRRRTRERARRARCDHTATT